MWSHVENARKGLRWTLRLPQNGVAKRLRRQTSLPGNRLMSVSEEREGDVDSETGGFVKGRSLEQSSEQVIVEPASIAADLNGKMWFARGFKALFEMKGGLEN